MLELTVEQAAALAEMDAKRFVERVRDDLVKEDPNSRETRRSHRGYGGHSLPQESSASTPMKTSSRFSALRPMPPPFMTNRRRERGSCV